MNTTLATVTGNLTLDDLENLAFTYGGQVVRNLSDDSYMLQGAVFAGCSVDLGPVRGDA